MLASLNKKRPALKATSRDSTLSNYPQSPVPSETICQPESHQLIKKELTSINLEEKITKYFIEHPEKLEEISEAQKKGEKNLTIKERKKYKKRRWGGHSYGYKVTLCLGYIIQAYWFAYGIHGRDIYPSKATLAEELGVCIRTLDKALKALKEMGVVTWISGKSTFTTNIYCLAEAYKTTPMSHPGLEVECPRHLWLKIQNNLKNQKLKSWWPTIYEHILKDIADHMLRIYNFIRTSIKKNSKNSFKSSKDPPKERQKPPNWEIMRSLHLNFKDQNVLGGYSEAVLRLAIDDMDAYENWGKVINNKGAFLMSRCKVHEKEMKAKQENAQPSDIKEWLSSYFKAHLSSFQFINDEIGLDRSTTDSRPFIALKFHKEDFKRSILKVFQKVRGSWVDKIFNFDRPDLYTDIKTYLESSLQELRFSKA